MSLYAKTAFTLIELLVVIAIIAILAAILFPVFAQAKQAAKKTMSLSNVRQIGTAANLYMGDYDDVTPPVFWFDPNAINHPTAQGFHYYPLLMLPYTKNRQIFLCPNDRATDPALTDPTGRGRFDPNSIFADYSMAQTPAMATTTAISIASSERRSSAGCMQDSLAECLQLHSAAPRKL
ncbi:MAG: prepilin-type N-terminal cleavage/methylation domain-containing protein [Fimbriimonadaceae bacterium]